MPELKTSLDPRSGPDISRGIEVPMEETAGQAYPDIHPGEEPKFLLFWQPGEGSYSVRRLGDGTPVLVPRIQILRGFPGVGSVSGEDGLDFSRAMAEIVKRGGIVFDAATCRRIGLPSYLRAHQTSYKGAGGTPTFIYLPPWRYPKRRRSGQWFVDCDDDVKTRWEEHLLTSGAVPVPEQEDLQNILGLRQRAIQRHENGATQKDQIAKQLHEEDLRAEQKAINAFLKTVDELSPGTSYALPEAVEVPTVKVPVV